VITGNQEVKKMNRTSAACFQRSLCERASSPAVRS
jgi:hypothetical protein